jgi:CRISPR type III-A-associated protein Csm2
MIQADRLAQWPAERLVAHAREIATRLRGQGGRDEQATKTQLRRVLDAVLKVEMDARRGQFSRDAVVLLLPRLSYAASRQPALGPLVSAVEEAIPKVRGTDDLGRLVRFVEAVVAYYEYGPASRPEAGGGRSGPAGPRERRERR